MAWVSSQLLVMGESQSLKLPYTQVDDSQFAISMSSSRRKLLFNVKCQRNIKIEQGVNGDRTVNMFYGCFQGRVPTKLKSAGVSFALKSEWCIFSLEKETFQAPVQASDSVCQQFVCPNHATHYKHDVTGAASIEPQVRFMFDSYNLYNIYSTTWYCRISKNIYLNFKEHTEYLQGHK